MSAAQCINPRVMQINEIVLQILKSPDYEIQGTLSIGSNHEPKYNKNHEIVFEVLAKITGPGNIGHTDLKLV